LIFAEYLNRLFWHATKAEVSPDEIPDWAIKLTATVAVILVSIICVATPKLGTRAAVAFTVVKVAALVGRSSRRVMIYINELFQQVSITVLGIVQLARGRASSSFSAPWFDDASTSPSSYALALYSGLWAFDGWVWAYQSSHWLFLSHSYFFSQDQANYVGGEMKNPGASLPRAIHSSMVVVLVSLSSFTSSHHAELPLQLLFLSANVSYLVVLDKGTVGRSNTVALDFGRALFGPMGGSVFAFMVAFSCFGALNGMA
jgi:amino acid transporter